MSELEPDGLEHVRRQFPRLAAELVLGKEGGASEARDELDIDRAQVMLQALEAAKRTAERELPSIRTRMITARKRRLWSQIASVVCSSGVLAALALSQEAISIITAALALLASIGTMISEHQERLLKQGDGDIYEAYDKAGQAAYKAGLMSGNLRLLMKHKAENDELRSAVESANALCEELNLWVIRMLGSNPNHA